MVPRPAATVVVVRPGEGGSGIEVLVLTRSAVSRFAPGFLVFPGGTVEPGDEERAGCWFGRPAEAARACAVRELAEETGLVVTGLAVVSAPGRLPGDGDLDPPDLSALPEVARWVAPEFLQVRFDARFFALAVPRGVSAIPDGIEVEAVEWAIPDRVLKSRATRLMWPTLRTLEALRGCRTVEDVLRLRVEQVPPPPGYPGPETISGGGHPGDAPGPLRSTPGREGGPR